MATRVEKTKSAMETLAKSFDSIVSEAKKRMAENEFKQAEKKFDEVASRVRASRGRRRETA